MGTMKTQRDGPSLGRWSLVLLLLGLVMPLAIVAQVLSYQEAVLRAIDGINQRSSDANLYRLLDLDPRPTMDGDPDTPKPVSFTVKETVCPRTTQKSPQDCDFKEDGLVKRCVGTVTLNQAGDSFDISCDKVSAALRNKNLPGGLPPLHCPAFPKLPAEETGGLLAAAVPV
ncbi:cathelicidin antimicrobial peptide isoform X2 [Piliocolobus tephrosceles]|uniref:Cathelicidin antimicrobial peptide n=1 Tax=Piliocolobus tephrosceles TaxID=591936 RepID=A0A8C9LIG5_9PRIM|nr:cathelicidin antimicrobial peptide isoform X2 [Piliocolobus tephrosceles]